jgi:hypothetical protein
MSKSKFLSYWVLIFAILLFVLGVIHNTYTPEIYRTAIKALSKELAITLTYTFVTTGNAMIFMGILAFYTCFGLKRSERWAWVVALSTGIFLALIGVGAIFLMPDDPFTYVISAIGVVMILPLLLYYKNFT